MEKVIGVSLKFYGFEHTNSAIKRSAGNGKNVQRRLELNQVLKLYQINFPAQVYTSAKRFNLLPTPVSIIYKPTFTIIVSFARA